MDARRVGGLPGWAVTAAAGGDLVECWEVRGELVATRLVAAVALRGAGGEPNGAAAGAPVPRLARIIVLAVAVIA